jgi:hypothetical protein
LIAQEMIGGTTVLPSPSENNALQKLQFALTPLRFASVSMV